MATERQKAAARRNIKKAQAVLRKQRAERKRKQHKTNKAAKGGKTGAKWIQKALNRKGKKGAPRGRGTLTAEAKRYGYSSPMEFARHVLATKGAYNKITEQRAQLAINLQKNRHNK